MLTFALNKRMKTVGIIRERGQLTIPDSIRKAAQWTATGAVISMSLENPQELVLTPHQPGSQMAWEQLVEKIKKSRSIKGKGDISAGEFISKDRVSF
jgi:bifunctional DNA-binding transcriptional regulator/antitoxin component of YhaV-PrlF toxin-antitoxin module